MPTRSFGLKNRDRLLLLGNQLDTTTLQAPMSHRTTNHRGLLAALVGFFMVFVLPACWFGALERANRLGTLAPSSSNSNEEREEHEEQEVVTRDAQGQRPPVPRVVVEVKAPVQRVAVAMPAAPVVTFAPEPSVLSVKRLL